MRTRAHVAAIAAVAILAVAGCSSTKSSNADDSSSKAAAPSGQDSGQTSAKTVDLPEGWPAALKMPSGTTVTEADKIGTGGSLMVVAKIDGDGQPVFDAFESQVSGAGYTIVRSTFTPSDKGGYGSISAKGDKDTVAIAFGPNDNATINQVTINVAPVDPSAG